MRILEFKEFKNLLLEDEPAAAAAIPPPAPEAEIPPPPPAPDMGMPPAPDMGAGLPPDPNAAPVTPAATTSPKIIFIQDAENKKWFGSHDGQGGVKRFTQYEIEPEALTKWLEVHKMESDKDLVMAALAGRRDFPANIYSEFKEEVKDGLLGVDKGTVDVTFDSDDNFNNPTSDNLEVVFLRSK
jgi:hypothetical protein